MGGMTTSLYQRYNVAASLGPIPYLFPVLMMSIEAAQWSFLRVLGPVSSSDPKIPPSSSSKKSSSSSSSPSPSPTSSSPLAYPTRYHLLNVFYRSRSAFDIFLKERAAGASFVTPTSAAGSVSTSPLPDSDTSLSSAALPRPPTGSAATVAGLPPKVRRVLLYALSIGFTIFVAIFVTVTPLIFPFDFEAYIKYHFTKVRQKVIYTYIYTCIYSPVLYYDRMFSLHFVSPPFLN